MVRMCTLVRIFEVFLARATIIMSPRVYYIGQDPHPGPLSVALPAYSNFCLFLFINTGTLPRVCAESGLQESRRSGRNARVSRRW